MNKNTCSAECIHGMCSACEYEDCACECHMQWFDPDYDQPLDLDDPREDEDFE